MALWVIILIVVVSLFVLVMVWRLRNLHGESYRELSQVRLSGHRMWDGVGSHHESQRLDRDVTNSDRQNYVNRMVDHYIRLRSNEGETHEGAMERVQISASK